MHGGPRLLWVVSAIGAGAALLFGAMRPVAAAEGSEYIGARRCKACHRAAYAQWRETPHARAADALLEAERRDPRCAACHSTSVQDGLEGVQCESCHGPGRQYWPEFIMRDVGLAHAVGLQSGGEPALCAGCHTADTPAVRPFDLATALDAVRHAREAR